METDNEFVVWKLVETSHEWIEFIKIGSSITLEGAQKIGEQHGGCWGVRRNTEPKPSYINDDDKWL